MRPNARLLPAGVARRREPRRRRTRRRAARRASGPWGTTHQAAAPAARAAAPPTTRERRRTERRRSSTSAAGSGGSPWPASRVSTTASRSTSRAQSAGASPWAARAASWAATRRRRRVVALSRTFAGGIPSRSATSSGPAAHTEAAPTRARSSGLAARTTASRAVSTGSSSSAAPHGSAAAFGAWLGGGAAGTVAAERFCGGRGCRRECGREHRAPRDGAGASLVERLAPVLVQPGQRLRGDPACGRRVEGDDERDGLEVGPASGHELAEVVLDGEGHRSSLTPAPARVGGPTASPLARSKVSAGRWRRPRRPRGSARWPGRTRP